MISRFSVLLTTFTLLVFHLKGQEKKPRNFGFRHERILFKEDSVDILIKSAKGDENKPKPLFFFCQGSMPQPLLKTDGELVYGVFPFAPDSLLQNYHLVIVSKPYIPLIKDKKDLDINFCFFDTINGGFKKYSDRNNLEYYVKRNIFVLSFLLSRAYVLKKGLVVAGHSEGSTIAAKMAFEDKRIEKLIYSGGNPLGRILSMLQEARSRENDSTAYGEGLLKYWEDVCKQPLDNNNKEGDSNHTTFSFSQPSITYIRQLKIPVLVCYGTKDWSAPFNDYMQVEFIQTNLKNVTFKAYVGLEHNYFPLNANGRPDYSQFKWDEVANYWNTWLKLLK